jgi:hypothetical protein
VTPATLFPDVRVLINDTDATAYRYSDSVLITKLDSALKRVSVVRPDLFTTIGNVPCVALTTVQQVPNYGRVVEVFQVAGGGGVVEANREVFDISYPTWRSDPAGPAVNWMRHARNPSVFFIYPQAPIGQVLLVEYTVAPTVAAVNDPIGLNDMYAPIVQDLLVATIEWGDDEHNLSQRAEAFYKRAIEQLSITLKTREVTDAETGGESEQASQAM